MSSEGSAEKYSIASALQVMQASLLTLAFSERYDLPRSKVSSVIIRPDNQFEMMLDDVAFSHLQQELTLSNRTDIAFNAAISSIVILNPEQWLSNLAGQKIFDKFPFFSEILNVANYHHPDAVIEKSLVKRCRLMARMWEEWGREEGLPHLLSGLQALFRQVAAHMKSPFVLNLPAVIENGLSVEYQCEIYADQLYGAKLLDVWNHYLLSNHIDNKKLEHFKFWLRDYPNDELIKKFGINKEIIPTVTYMRDSETRLAWKLSLNGLVISNDRLPSPKDEPLEIIYVLGRHDNELCFFGGLKERGIINHSSFFAGQTVEGAGRMILIPYQDANGVKQWKLSHVDNNSGHIKPDNAMSIKVLIALQAAGVNLEDITWRSKWGSPGLRDESAAQALQRLQKKFFIVQAKDFNNEVSSLLLQKFVALANHGNIQDLYHYYFAKCHEINRRECDELARVLLDSIERGLERNGQEYRLLDKLADQVWKLMRISGNYQLAFMERVRSIKSRVMELEHCSIQRHKLFHGSNDRQYNINTSDDHSPEFNR